MSCSDPNSTQPLALGIDAGGTYTDAVLVTCDGARVIAQAKALTTPHDLSIGIANALDMLSLPDRQAIRSVSLATTLATNAIVEKRGGRVALLLIGYDRRMLAQFNLLGNLPVVDRLALKGRLNEQGQELEPLDESEVRSVLQQLRGRVEALAVSGYFSVSNPIHEQQVMEMAVEVLAVPVVCGHELTSRLDAVKRAVTAALNARLLPILNTLLDALEACLHERGITAPLLMMGGEGRLLTSEEVRRRPVETILSGPAASVSMARLAHLSEGIVIDMGGTTSDIAVLRNGSPGLSPDGALVGGWPTSVNAVDVRTCGLGGDSHIQLLSGRLKVGPRRACPVCLAAREHDEVLPHLRRLDALSRNTERSFPVSLTDFVVQVRSATGLQLNWQERAVLDQVKQGPVPLVDILDRMDGTHLHVQGIAQLEERGLVQQIGLTPTDLLHAQGRYDVWDAEAAVLATGILARQFGLDAGELCRQVEEQIVDQLAVEVMARLLKDQDVEEGGGGWDSYLLRRALDGQDPDAPLQCRIGLRDPLIGLGAPAGAYLPRLAEKMNTTYVELPYAEVGVALGTVLGQLADFSIEC